MPAPDERNLVASLADTASPGTARVLGDRAVRIDLGDLPTCSFIRGGTADLAGRSVLLACRDQLPAALAMIELDGVVRRLVLCPPDTSPDHLLHIAAAAEIDAVVTDGHFSGLSTLTSGQTRIVAPQTAVRLPRRPASHVTEWVLATSGTTGVPKLVAYTRAILAAAIKQARAPETPPVWSTFYDIRRYGGLQIFLRALLGGGSLVLSDPAEPVADFLARAGRASVSHMSGTPSHWRRAIMSGATGAMAPRYIRLSGEIADQAILDALKRAFPGAEIAHAFASTEAGVAFDVGDGKAGFPAALIDAGHGPVAMKVVDGSLRIRSNRTAIRYLGAPETPLKDSEGFVDTGDIIVRDGERCYFAGRRGGVINVGGAKVYPEEVEAVLHSLPFVDAARVYPRRSAFTGALVAADVVINGAGPAGKALDEAAIIAACQDRLPPYKVPAVVRIVATLDVAASGKLSRRHV